MTHPEFDDALARLDALLATEAHAHPPVVPDALMARLMADAVAEMPRACATPQGPSSLGARLLAHIADALRDFGAQLGAPVLASLGGVMLVGLMLGAYPPEAVLSLEDVIFGAELTLDLAALPAEFAQ